MNRISLIASNGAATGCAASGIPWKASRVNSYTEDAKPAYRSAAVGYRKVHCSDWRRMHASDVTFAALLSMADADHDGSMSRQELALSFTERPTAWAYALRATCLSFAFGRDTSLRRYVEHGPAWPAMGEPVVNMMRSARLRHQRDGATSSPCLFWAEEALALNFVLPKSIAQLQSQIEQLAEPLIGTLTRKLSRKDRYWRNLESPRHNGTDAELRPNHDVDEFATSSLQALGRELAEALFTMSDTDGDGLASFDDMKVAMSKPGSISASLVPACWRAGGWFGAHLSPPGNTGLGLAAGVPHLTPEQLAAVDFEARLKSLQAGFRSRFHFWYVSSGLAQSLSAGSLLFARAALCCERCGNRDQGCRTFDSVDPVSHRMVSRVSQPCSR